MTHALPDYLTRNVSFDDCPPGHRFGLYFDGWREDFSIPRDGKTGLFRTVAGALPTLARDPAVEYAEPGTTLRVVVRGQSKKARVETTPFIDTV